MTRIDDRKILEMYKFDKITQMLDRLYEMSRKENIYLSRWRSGSSDNIATLSKFVSRIKEEVINISTEYDDESFDVASIKDINELLGFNQSEIQSD